MKQHQITIKQYTRKAAAATIPCFETRLDRFWNSQVQKCNYSELIKTTGHDLSKTSIDKELTEEVSVVLQSEEDL